MLGLYKVGLEGLTTKIFALIVGIGFAIKEPVADLISYFILLVQRPIKIGDFVRINISSSPDGDVQGLVRQITPRATLIRQRNSQTIIVPNSILLTRAVTNWNYIRGFVAAEDIFLHVSFEHDPEVVRSLLQKVVESHPAVLKNPAPIVWCHNFTPSGYQFLVRGFIASDRAAEQFEIGSQIRILLVKKLRQAQITISAPHVYIKSNFVDNEQKFMDYFHKDSGQ